MIGRGSPGAWGVWAGVQRREPEWLPWALQGIKHQRRCRGRGREGQPVAMRSGTVGAARTRAVAAWWQDAPAERGEIEQRGPGSRASDHLSMTLEPTLDQASSVRPVPNAGGLSGRGWFANRPVATRGRRVGQRRSAAGPDGGPGSAGGGKFAMRSLHRTQPTQPMVIKLLANTWRRGFPRQAGSGPAQLGRASSMPEVARLAPRHASGTSLRIRRGRWAYPGGWRAGSCPRWEM